MRPPRARSAAASGFGPVLFDRVRAKPLPGVSIDLPAQRLCAGEHRVAFRIDARSKQLLIAAWDTIERTLQQRDAIRAFEACRLAGQLWLA